MPEKKRKSKATYLQIREWVKELLLFTLIREMEITSRYFQFRMKDLVARGVPVYYSQDMKMDGLKVKLVLSVEVPEDAVRNITKAELKKYRRLEKMQKLGEKFDVRQYTSEEFEEQVKKREEDSVIDLF